MPVPARPVNGGASDHRFTGRASALHIAFLRGVLVESARLPGGVWRETRCGEGGCGCVAAVGGAPRSGSADAACVVSAGT